MPDLHAENWLQKLVKFVFFAGVFSLPLWAVWNEKKQQKNQKD